MTKLWTENEILDVELMKIRIKVNGVLKDMSGEHGWWIMTKNLKPEIYPGERGHEHVSSKMIQIPEFGGKLNG